MNLPFLICVATRCLYLAFNQGSSILAMRSSFTQHASIQCTYCPSSTSRHRSLARGREGGRAVVFGTYLLSTSFCPPEKPPPRTFHLAYQQTTDGCGRTDATDARVPPTDWLIGWGLVRRHEKQRGSKVENNMVLLTAMLIWLKSLCPSCAALCTNTRRCE